MVSLEHQTLLSKDQVMELLGGVPFSAYHQLGHTRFPLFLSLH